MPLVLWFSSLALLLTLSVAGAQPIDSAFPGLDRFRSVAYEISDEPADPLSPLIEVQIDELEPDGVGYRNYLVSGRTPSSVETDVCPAGYETIWYTFTSSGGPVEIGFHAEIEPLNSTPGRWFSPISMDDYRARAGNPRYSSPVHVGFCAYSNKRGGYRRSHDIFTRNPGSLGHSISCEIAVNNSGRRVRLDYEASTCFIVYCNGDR
jgi:hypothetical protein